MAEVSWTAVPGATRYRLAILNEGEDPANPQHWDSRAGWEQLTGTVLNVDNLTPGTQYRFRVKACIADACSDGRQSAWFRSPRRRPRESRYGFRNAD